MIIRRYIEAMTEQVQDLGHRGVWHTVGTQVAHATCHNVFPHKP